MRLKLTREQLYTQLEEARDALIAYCETKVRTQDWHAVQDAASDIREIDAKLDLLHALGE